MSKKKNKLIKFEKLMGAMFGFYNPKRPIKDIENNCKHKPKGQR